MKRTLCLFLFLFTFPTVLATEPPDLINYQGVLRDAADNPLNGDYDMVFRFWGAETGGHEVILDRHTTLDSAPVTVSDGMFAVELGAGLVQDGAGPDDYTSLHKLFKNYSTCSTPAIWSAPQRCRSLSSLACYAPVSPLLSRSLPWPVIDRSDSQTVVEARRGGRAPPRCKVQLAVSYVEGRKHLPVIELRRAA